MNDADFPDNRNTVHAT